MNSNRIISQDAHQATTTFVKMQLLLPQYVAFTKPIRMNPRDMEVAHMSILHILIHYVAFGYLLHICKLI